MVNQNPYFIEGFFKIVAIDIPGRKHILKINISTQQTSFRHDIMTIKGYKNLYQNIRNKFLLSLSLCHAFK